MNGNNLSDELNRLNDEAKQIDEQIRQLRTRKRDVEEKIANIESRIAAKNNIVENDQSVWETETFSWSGDIRQTLRDSFRLEEFRPLQLSAINAVMSGEDCLLIMSTGGGKSLTYQLPAVVKKGITLVISPLISLIEDQIIQLKKLGIQAATLNQSSTKEEVKFVHDALGDQTTNLRLLYVTPEKLSKSKRIMNRLEKCVAIGLLELIAVDEVHCCSQWGHDFRPDYKFLNILKRQFKGVPLLGLTATATANVLDDVKEILGIRAAITFRATFNRENLFYEVRSKPASNEEISRELASAINKEFANESGIVYCFSRKECEELANGLRARKIAAEHYHAYLEPDKRRKVHEKWLRGQCKVIVATLAFGMGIDKPDVRFVIHHTLAKSMESYYQESGRAGRDGKTAKCILYYKLADLFRQSTMICSEKTGIQNLYSMLAYSVRNGECRRICIAEHFDESWDVSWCREMCDVCKWKRDLSSEIDAIEIILEIRRIIDEQEGTDQSRITGNKLMDVLTKTVCGRRYSRDALEQIVANLLLAGYLYEDFHFTPYNIISYVRVTERTRQLTFQSKLPIRIALRSNAAAGRKGRANAEGAEAPLNKRQCKTANDDVVELSL